jgi:glycosyltransferase involved in cell wall biosynthesis
MGLGTPIICSDIVENKFITGENATHFKSGSVGSLVEKINYSLTNTRSLTEKAKTGQEDVLKRFNWDSITDKYIALFNNKTDKLC